MSAQTLNVGLVGYGMAGQVFHAPLINATPGMRLAAIVQRRDHRPIVRYPQAAILPDAAALYADPTIDLAVIATPNDTHANLARAALRAGKHVVIDKPFTINSADADDLITLAQQQQRLISVFQNRRWDGDFRTVQHLVAAGHLGRLVAYHSHFDRFRNTLRPNAWREGARPGSGILYDLGAHLLDQALTLFGPPEALSAEIRTERDGAQADDRFELVLHYSRLRVSLGAGMLLREARPRFALYGTAGSYVKHGLDPQEAALKAGSVPTAPDWGQEPENAWGLLNTTIGDLHIRGAVETLPGQYQAYYANLHAALTAGTPLAVRPEQARAVIRLIEYAQESAAARRTIDVRPDA
jgi:scyllo-inositol 2-dehydrogenase (NADP+)